MNTKPSRFAGILRWLPALILMAVIFALSSTPSTDLPNYGFWDALVKKGGHVAGYTLLSLSYWYGLGFDPQKGWLAWLLAVLYAITDEVHQAFTPGRTPSATDVLVFDAFGALLGCAIGRLVQKHTKPAVFHS
ncbi:MAG: hypothetical protein DDG60_15180 [Anaerolineae bacterium]|nr:MAG: hypothetical protein DDG60_15180 [Anaerolineae bacterium]